ncbi:MAG: outer membrane receptor for ferric coprogen and ferric-rhodotorulic acid, partial [Aquabacterium sp.]|uniref:putative porin n=1 Tax=Aquabacterium sp. TaxID=1872578 RepID=UPI001216D339
VRVPYVPESVKNEMREQIKQEVLAQAHEERWGDPGALPAWMRSISVEGDLRVRYQHDLFDRSNNSEVDAQGGFLGQATNSLAWAPDLSNSTHDRDRMNLRARFGIKSKLNDDFSAGIRLSTGNGDSPTAVSQTQGNYFNKYSTYFDQAYIKYNHEGETSAVAGRFANPFVGTDLTWPDDINFDGLAVSYKPALGAGHAAFLTMGAFPLQEFETSRADKWLYGAQVGASLNIAPNVQFRAGLSYYDFHGVEGVSDTNIGSSSSSFDIRPNLSTQYPSKVRQKGNTLFRINNNGVEDNGQNSIWGLASKFRPVDLSAEVTFLHFFPVTVKASLDFIKNIGFQEDDIHARAGSVLNSYTVAKKTNAVQAKVAVGVDRIDRAGQWQSFLAYRRFERDAWLDAFTDTTWHLGGTNYQGWSIGGQYGIAPRTSLGLRWTSTRNLSDATLYGSAPGYSDAILKIDVLQLELNTRF